MLAAEVVVDSEDVVVPEVDDIPLEVQELALKADQEVITMVKDMGV